MIHQQPYRNPKNMKQNPLIFAKEISHDRNIVRRTNTCFGVSNHEK